MITGIHAKDKITININPIIKKDFKNKCALENIEMSVKIRNLIMNYLKEVKNY